MARTVKMTQQGFPQTLPWLEDPNADDDADEKAKAEAAKAQTPNFEAQIAALEARIANMTDASKLLTMQAPQMAPQFRTDVDLSNMPDSLTEPDAYAKELNQRLNAAMSERQRAAQYQAQKAAHQTELIGDLWEEFQEKYPQYSDKTVGIEAIATKVAEKAARRGVDVNKYMFTTSDKFMADVVAAYDKEFGKPVVAGAEEDDEDDAPAASVFGGAVSGGKSGLADEDAAVKPDDMFNDMKDWQLKSGFYR